MPKMWSLKKKKEIFRCSSLIEICSMIKKIEKQNQSNEKEQWTSHKLMNKLILIDWQVINNKRFFLSKILSKH